MKCEIISTTYFDNDDKEYIIDMDIMQFYYYGYGRNAWHSVWSSYYIPSTVYSSFIETRNAVEHLRTQGSVFNINEIPCLHISTNIRDFLLIDFGHTKSSISSNSFSSLYFALSESEFFAGRSYFCKFKEIVENNMERFAFYSFDPDEESSDDVLKIKKNKTFHRFSSHSVGTQYYLQYRKCDTKINCEYALSLIDLLYC